MSKIFSNIYLIVSISVALVVFSATKSYCTSQWHWFGRSGAIITMAGIILCIRPIIRMGFNEWVKSLKIIDGGHCIPTPEEIEEERQANLDADALRMGNCMALIGTLIWAYGDLVGGIP